MTADAPLRAALEAANEGFYRAFERLDVGAMSEVWLHADHVKCIHPGWPLLVGWDAVRESWSAIFRSTAEMRFTLSDVRAVAGDDGGWVTCTENILAEVGGRISVTAVLATNVFERAGDGWKMVHHHASHVLTAPPAQ